MQLKKSETRETRTIKSLYHCLNHSIPVVLIVTLFQSTLVTILPLNVCLFTSLAIGGTKLSFNVFPQIKV